MHFLPSTREAKGFPLPSIRRRIDLETSKQSEVKQRRNGKRKLKKKKKEIQIF
jgi:hypothetical protein